MIKFENVFIKYTNDFYSLYDFSCEINSHTLFVGDFFNGTSAIMRTLAKIDKNYNGEIFVDNTNLKNIKDIDLDIAYLPKIPVLFKNKSIEKNLAYPLKIRKINKKIIKNTINSLFFEYKLDNFNKKIKKLNFSEQKIISLLRALIRKPRYILLENFFENLDKTHFDLAVKILSKLKETSTIIACEETKDIEFFKDFTIVEL